MMTKKGSERMIKQKSVVAEKRAIGLIGALNESNNTLESLKEQAIEATENLQLGRLVEINEQIRLESERKQLLWRELRSIHSVLFPKATVTLDRLVGTGNE